MLFAVGIAAEVRDNNEKDIEKRVCRQRDASHLCGGHTMLKVHIQPRCRTADKRNGMASSNEHGHSANETFSVRVVFLLQTLHSCLCLLFFCVSLSVLYLAFHLIPAASFNCRLLEFGAACNFRTKSERRITNASHIKTVRRVINPSYIRWIKQKRNISSDAKQIMLVLRERCMFVCVYPLYLE